MQLHIESKKDLLINGFIGEEIRKTQISNNSSSWLTKVFHEVGWSS